MLSVVVIGKNGAALLSGCLSSVQEALTGTDFELLYVDAHSSDDSVRVAQSFGARVLMPEAQNTTPALGRAIGAKAARGEVLLFLDNDMQLCPGFVAPAYAALQESAGVVGEREDVFLQGGQEIGRESSVFGIRETRPARAFGGALLIRRDALLQAGNYAPGVEATEEMELYARLQKQGYVILEIPEKMIVHFDEHRENRSLFRLFVNRRRLGLGQAVIHAMLSGSLPQLMRLHAASFVLWLLDLVALLLALGFGGIAWLLPVLLQVPLLLWRLANHSPRSYVSDTLLLVYLPLGLCTYRKRNLSCDEIKEHL